MPALSARVLAELTDGCHGLGAFGLTVGAAGTWLQQTSSPR
jgi:hypothetical protein